MVNFTLKGIPDDLYADLKEMAEQNRRSINGEILIQLEEALGKRPRDSGRLLARIDALRDRLQMQPLTDKFLETAKRQGRA